MPYRIVYRRGLAGWLLATFVAGSISAFHGDVFYGHLIRSPWAASMWLFASTWGLLYLLAGTAAWMVWKTAGFRGDGGIALSLYLIQLAFHALWSWLLLVRHDTALAAVEIVLHDLLVIATMVAFWRLRPLAAALLLPYLIWIGFAYALTMKMWEQRLMALE